MSFGPGNAFAAFAPTVARPPRRVNSSGSFKDDPKYPGGGPTPVDLSSGHPPFASGVWGERERENSSSSAAAAAAAASQLNGGHDTQQRSASSLSSFGQQQQQEVEGGGAAEAGDRRFVYSREFLLTFFDDKACKRAVELALQEVGATKENQATSTAKPWSQGGDWRDAEKEHHHSNPRSTRSSHRGGDAFSGYDTTPGGGGGRGGTLDLASLGTLPRDRDRALQSPSLRDSTSSRDRLSLGSIGRSPSSGPTERGAEKDLANARRARPELRSLGSSSMGITGGVLGGIGTRGSPTSAIGGGGAFGSPSAKDAGLRGSPRSKDVWQGGRWRRQGTEAEEEKVTRPSAFGARRFPTNDSLLDSPTHRSRESSVALDDDHDEAQRSSLPTPPDSDGVPVILHRGSSALDAYLTEPDLAHHATSILGSLALDSDPIDDPLLRPVQQHIPSAPPGLAPPAPVTAPADSTWQYRDPTGQVQGPFAVAMMQGWYQGGHLPSDLRVKRSQELDYETLESLVRRSGNADNPFITAPLQTVSTLPPPTPQAAAGGAWPVASTPLDQFSPAAGGQRSFNSFYETFGGQAASSPAPFDLSNGQQHQSSYGFGQPQQQQQQQRSVSQGGLDPWGAPLPSASPAGWNDANHNLFGAAGGYGQQQALHQQYQPQQSPVDLFRQLTQQQQQQNGVTTDLLGRPQSSLPPSPFFDPRQLQQQQQQVNGGWQQPQQAQQQPQQQQQPWASLIAPTLSNPLLDSLPSPIGPPASAVQSPAQTFSQVPQSSLPTPAPVSPWGSVSAPAPPTQKVEEPLPVASPPQPQQTVLPPPVPAVEAITSSSKTPATDRLVASVSAQAREAVAGPAAVAPVVSSSSSPTLAAPSTPLTVPAPTSSPAPKPVTVAPWIKDDEPSTPSGPSLREIQEAEAREADKRKAAARIVAAQANIQAAQRAAALEAAEQLPASVNWASPASVPTSTSSSPVANKSGGAPVAPAPWSKPKAAPVGKTLKEIQEEEEKRKKAAAALAAQNQSPIASRTGYAGSIGQTAASKATAGAPWTTIAVKPAAVPVVASVRPIIPGALPASGTSLASRIASLPAKPVASVVATRPIASTPVPAAVAAPTVVRSALVVPAQTTPSRPSSKGANGTVYDAETPPPPSAEFMKWCKDALKGLTVPMDEFIQMLLSFPLDASADVLEIISDSVYANSSTLDGRRFANEFVSRRKNDVAVRYPNIVMSKSTNKLGGGKPSSMAEALKSQPVAKTPEWSVKVAGGKKKKKSG